MNLAGTLDKQPDSAELAADSPTVEQVYRDHADFVWTCLQRFGVRDDDLDDLMQEVFVVVHRNLRTFRGESRLTTWLYAICLRVAAANRRRRKSRVVLAIDEPGLVVGDERNPEGDLALSQRRRALDAILDQLDLEKRAVFVMFEIDELCCDQIAAIIGVPVGTVYSRLHAARKAFEKAAARFRVKAREGVR